MSTPVVRRPVTARDIILEVIRNMREGLEPLHYTTLPPAIYHVYLHPEDFARLRGIFPRMQDETRKALDDEMAELNRASLGERLKLARKPASKVVPPEGGWRIEFFENTDDGVAAGDIEIYSELALPAKPEYGAGSMTKRINTRRVGGKPPHRRNTKSGCPKPCPRPCLKPGRWRPSLRSNTKTRRAARRTAWPRIRS